MGQCTEKNKLSLSVSTSEERPQKSKETSYPGVSMMDVVTTVSRLMEQKRDIAITGVSKYLS